MLSVYNDDITAFTSTISAKDINIILFENERIFIDI